MGMIKKILRDINIIISRIWINLLLFVCLMSLGAVLLKLFGDTPGASWLILFLDVFHLATIERVDPGGRIIPIVLAFVLPIGVTLILGEGILRVISVYLQREQNRKDWDHMVIKDYRDHTIICSVGEMGRQIARRMVAEQPNLQLVLIDPRPGILTDYPLPMIKLFTSRAI